MSWHLADETDIHSRLLEAVQALSSVYCARRETWRQALSRFLDRAVTLGEAETYQTECFSWLDRKARNAIGSVVETVHSHCTTMKPRPAFRTVANSATLQQRVKLLQRAIDALLDKQNVEAEASRVCLDALIGGDAFLRAGVHDGEPIAERVAPYRLLLDPAETCLRKPLTFYHVYYADSDALKEQYSDCEQHCIGAPVLTDNNSLHSGRVVQCIEAIRVPATRKGKGRRVVFTSSGVLEDEPYTYPESPFYSLRWLQNPESPYGIGIPERLAGVQEDIDQREETIRDHEMAIGGTWLLPKGCGVTPDMLDNRRKALEVIPVNGALPQYVYPQAVAADVYASRDASVQAAYQFSGVTQLAATGEKPGGVTAAAALRRLEVVGSRRFARFYEDYQQMFVWVGRMFAYIIARDANVRRSGRLLVAGGVRGMQHVKVSELRVDPDLVDVRVRVSSFNATSEPELLQELTDLFGQNVITREQLIRLSQTRDLAAEYEKMTAPGELVDQLIEQMLADGVYVAPEPFYDLELCLGRAVLYYQAAVRDGLEQSKLQVLRDWIRAVLDLQGLTKPPPAPAPPPMPGAPGDPAMMGMGPGGPMPPGAPPGPMGPPPGPPPPPMM